jgi:hypothetical protein
LHLIAAPDVGEEGRAAFAAKGEAGEPHDAKAQPSSAGIREADCPRNSQPR